MTDSHTLVLDASGVVIRVALGAPADVPHAADETVVARDGAAAKAWFGWVRLPDGTWPDPHQPIPPDAAALAAYARARSKVIEEQGVDLGGSRIATDRSSQGLVSRAVALFDADPTLTQIDFDTGTAVITLTKDEMTAIGIAVGRHVQGAFGLRAKALRAIQAVPPTATTTADVDAILVGQ